MDALLGQRRIERNHRTLAVTWLELAHARPETNIKDLPVHRNCWSQFCQTATHNGTHSKDLYEQTSSDLSWQSRGSTKWHTRLKETSSHARILDDRGCTENGA